MGIAQVIYKIYPEENTDLARLVEEIDKVDKIIGCKREPIAFGIEVLKAAAKIDDKKDKPDDVENALRAVEGVKDVEVEAMDLIS